MHYADDETEADNRARVAVATVIIVLLFLVLCSVVVAILVKRRMVKSRKLPANLKIYSCPPYFGHTLSAKANDVSFWTTPNARNFSHIGRRAIISI